MKKWNLVLLFWGLVGVLHTDVEGQDLHFSQFFNSPLTTNPANTGFLPDADFRVGAHYREQWKSIPVPYTTQSIYGDAQVFRDRFETGWIGLGGVLMRDVAGSGNLTSTKFYLSAAYHQMLGNTGLLSAGFNTGLSSKRIDISKFTFDNQWNGKFFDVQTPSNETFAANSMNYLDIQIGLNYAWFPSDKMYMHTGFSVQHVNKPSETFFTQTPNYNNQIARRYIYFADAVIKVQDNLILTPTTYFSSQANATEFMLGMHANLNMSQHGEQQLIAGMYYRGGDAFIPMVGYQWQNFRFTFSFDATTSYLKNYNNKSGATEMYLQYNGSYQNYNGDLRQSLCPSFR
jgi:type IX secretion system PorP/SprF family membrane protein